MKLLKQIIKKIKSFIYLKIFKKKYYRTGKCNKCGCCCENIYIRHKNELIKTLEEFEEIKKSDSYSFYHHITPIDKDDFGLIFKCDRFDSKKRLCLNHKKRPSICKNYPSEEIFSFGAALQEGCGFKFSPIQSFDEVFKKVLKKPIKNFSQID